ncbi:MAG: hypothetical protein MJZ23_04880 [Paludibacteraceae bacterium]|nr:hypothetical protein [Paludibacteraceae bacterium]
MNRSELIDMVKTFVNELSPTNGLPVPIDGFADDRPIDDAIDTLLNGAARTVLMLAPRSQLPLTQTSVVAQLGEDGCARLGKPPNYLRLGSIRLLAWQRPATVSVPSTGGVAQRQGNVYLRAGRCKPVAVDAGPYWQLWPAQLGDDLTASLEYVALTLPEDMAVGLQLATCWQCAALYLQISGDAQGATAAQMRAEQMLNA